jgi:hypothetical protein
MALPNEKFLNKIFVDKNIKKLIDEKMFWEQQLTKQPIDSLTVLYYKEQYYHVETPNDSAMSRTMDPGELAPAPRAEHGHFPHADISPPKEYNLRIYQLALEMDWSEEEMKYASMENRVMRKQAALADYFGSYVNNVLGNTLSETWTASPSSIQVVTASNGWNTTTSSVTSDLIGAQEKIDDLAGYAYSPGVVLMSKQSYYDVVDYLTNKNYEYSFAQPDTPKEVLKHSGLNVIKTNMVKRDYALVADFKSCGILFEAEPVETHPYFTDEDRTHHVQMTRRFNFALTDPKAICMVYNTVQ